MKQPVGIFIDFRDQFPFFFRWKSGLVFKIRRAGSDHAGERGSKIMGNRPQQVGAKLFFFCFKIEMKYMTIKVKGYPDTAKLNWPNG